MVRRDGDIGDDSIGKGFKDSLFAYPIVPFSGEILVG